MELVLSILVVLAVGVWAYYIGIAHGEEAVRREQDELLAARFPDAAALDKWISDWTDGYGTEKAD